MHTYLGSRKSKRTTGEIEIENSIYQVIHIDFYFANTRYYHRAEERKKRSNYNIVADHDMRSITWSINTHSNAQALKQNKKQKINQSNLQRPPPTTPLHSTISSPPNPNSSSSTIPPVANRYKGNHIPASTNFARNLNNASSSSSSFFSPLL